LILIRTALGYKVDIFSTPSSMSDFQKLGVSGIESLGVLLVTLVVARGSRRLRLVVRVSWVARMVEWRKRCLIFHMVTRWW